MEEITTGLEIVCSSKGKYTKISASELRLQSHTNKKIKKYLAKFAYICPNKIETAVVFNPR